MLRCLIQSLRLCIASVIIGYNGVSSLTYNFDSNNGNLISVQDNTGTTSFQYNEINRLLQKQLPSGTLATTDYDKVGNLTSFEDASGVVTYGYDNANRMTSLVEPDSATTSYGYDNANSRISIHYPNGTGQVMTYDNAGHILSDIGGKTNAGGSITTQYTNFGYNLHCRDKHANRLAAKNDVYQSCDFEWNAGAFVYV